MRWAIQKINARVLANTATNLDTSIETVMTNLIEVDPNTEIMTGRNTIPSPEPDQRRVVPIHLLITKRSLLPMRIGEPAPIIVNPQQVHHTSVNLKENDLMKKTEKIKNLRRGAIATMDSQYPITCF